MTNEEIELENEDTLIDLENLLNDKIPFQRLNVSSSQVEYNGNRYDLSLENKITIDNKIYTLQNDNKTIICDTDENDTKVVTLSDLIVSGKISKLQDSKGKECDEENSYIEATKNGNEYEVEVYLKCGNEEETIYVYKTSCDETKCSETTTTTTKKVATTKKANTNSNNTSNNQRPATTKKVEYITKVITKEKKYYVVFDTDKAASIPTQT